MESEGRGMTVFSPPHFQAPEPGGVWTKNPCTFSVPFVESDYMHGYRTHLSTVGISKALIGLGLLLRR